MNRLDQAVKERIPIGYELLATNAAAAGGRVLTNLFLFVGQCPRGCIGSTN